MYGFTEDKSRWNLGGWAVLTLYKSNFKPGIESDNANIAAYKPTKYVCEIDITNGNYKYLEAVLGETLNPMLIWAEITGGSNYGLNDNNETVEANGALIEDVYFQNQKIYVIANGELSTPAYNIKIKGA